MTLELCIGFRVVPEADVAVGAMSHSNRRRRFDAGSSTAVSTCRSSGEERKVV
jgi:hypothetical protein